MSRVTGGRRLPLPPLEIAERRVEPRFTPIDGETEYVVTATGDLQESTPVAIERLAERAELLDNPNDPRGRTNVQIAADALMAKCDGEVVRYDDEGTCEWLWDGEPVRGRRHCMCLTDAKTMVAALEATGRLKSNAGSARAALGGAEDKS